MIAALYVDTKGPYANREGVDAWDVERDARKYNGPWPVVAHPPCKRWGRYWSGGPSAKVRRKLGDDGGCFTAALASVRRWGGIIEHPEASHAWVAHGLHKPPRRGGWVVADDVGGWTCCVEQGHYGHASRKATWLYLNGCEPPSLTWGPSQGIRMDEGFHTNEERRQARLKGVQPVARLSALQRIHTPEPFARLLLQIASKCARHHNDA